MFKCYLLLHYCKWLLANATFLIPSMYIVFFIDANGKGLVASAYIYFPSASPYLAAFWQTSNSFVICRMVKAGSVITSVDILFINLL